MRFAVPNNTDVPWLLKERRDTARLDGLLVALTESATEKQWQQQQPQPGGSAKGKAAPKRPKRTTIANKGASSKPVNLGKIAKDIEAAESKTYQSSATPKLLLHDIAETIRRTEGWITQKHRDLEFIEKMKLTCIEFGLTGSATLSIGDKPKLFKGWKSLRRA
eukprot:15461859-Alexandrium_andersonii.AAC.1